MGYTFYIVDVFAEEKYAGNQLGIFRGIQALSGADRDVDGDVPLGTTP